jgi:thimet oligopeptidase
MQHYNIDEEVLKEYFPAEVVKEATMQIYQELLSLEFKKLPEVQVWHPEVTCYEVKDKQT